MELLPIVAITSHNYADVFSFWTASLDLLRYPSEKRHVLDLGVLTPPFGYCTRSWRCAIDAQLTHVVQWIREHQGAYFIHTDTDIQFFPRFLSIQSEWLRWMRAHRLDMIFMRERTNFMPEARVAEVNAGFYLVHCNSRTLQFWERVLAEEIAYPKMDGFPPYTDQYHVNRGLHYCHGEFPQRGHFGVRWSIIPDRHCVWSDLESWDEARLAAFHHAVNTQNKPELLRRVRNAVLAVQDVSEVVNRELMPMVRTSFSTKQLEEEAWRLATQASVQLTGEVCASCNGWVSLWWLLCWSAVDGKGFCCRCSDIWRAERATTDTQVSVRFFGSWSS